MAVSAQSYILTADDKAVLADGKLGGVILVGKGGTIDDALAEKYGVETVSAESVAANLRAVEDGRLADLNAARLAPMEAALSAAGTNPSGQTADKAAVEGGKKTAEASANKTSPLVPAAE